MAFRQYDGGGRVNQKARTRVALLESASQLIRQGKRPTVEEAALAAGISKRTAYRYFASQEHLLADAALEGLRANMDAMFDQISDSANVHVRIASLATALSRLAQAHEAELREMMRAALDRGAPVAGGQQIRGRRRLDWIAAALSPVKDRLAPDAYVDLVHSLAVCLGVDALIVLRDVCGLDTLATETLMTSMATSLVDQALAAATAP